MRAEAPDECVKSTAGSPFDFVFSARMSVCAARAMYYFGNKRIRAK